MQFSSVMVCEVSLSSNIIIVAADVLAQLDQMVDDTVGCRFNVIEKKHDITYITALTSTEYINPSLNSQKNTPYHALTCELWGVFHEGFSENRLRYNCTALY